MKWTHILIETERGRGAAHRPRVAHQLLGQENLVAGRAHGRRGRAVSARA